LQPASAIATTIDRRISFRAMCFCLVAGRQQGDSAVNAILHPMWR
jgi:hypothetical protein